MNVQQLKELDFTPGIRASEINYNFDLIYKWITRERLRVGGWGIVDGFDITCNPNDMTIHVTSGTFINKDGDEVEVPAKDFSATDIGWRENVDHHYKVNSEGQIFLDDYVYDKNSRRYLTYNPPDSTPVYNEYTLEVRDPNDYPINVLRVVGKTIYVDVAYADMTVKVIQRLGYDRIDAIMLDANGEYHALLESVESTSPSHVDLSDFDDKYLVGIVYWQITIDGIIGDIFINHRSYRRVYVDNNNVLWLNGEIYRKPKFIYFIEPPLSEREENDLWYDTKTNTLYIWLYKDGEYGWHIVNDHSEIVIKERKIWTPEENPEDLKTFKFEDEVNLHYVPGTNALDINIDCAPLMDDMYDELISTEAEMLTYKNRIQELQDAIREQEDIFASLERDKDELQVTLSELNSQLLVAKSLYPAAYSSDNATYQVTDADMPDLRNLVNIDQQVTEKLIQVGNIVTDMRDTQARIDDYNEQISAMQGILTGTYASTGIGFRLKEPLYHPSYVEMTVTHCVRMKPAREVFQRAAIFVKEGDITVTSSGTQQIFETSSYYSVGDEQLEIYVDGMRLSKGQYEFYEVVDDLSEEEQEALSNVYLNYDYNSEEHRASYYERSSKHFRIMGTLSVGQKISYRISKHVWSYGQLDTVISNLKSYSLSAYEKAEEALSDVITFQTNISDTLLQMSSDISRMNSNINLISDTYYYHGEEISWSDTATRTRDNTVGRPIDIMKNANVSIMNIPDLTIVKDSSTQVITGGDIFQIYYMSPDENRMLVREGNNRDEMDIDYWLQDNGSGTRLTLNDDLVSADAKIYITGFKRGADN